MHVVPVAARPAQAAGDVRVHDDGVPYLHVGDRRADLVYPAGVLVTRSVRQVNAYQRSPLALDNMQVRPAETSSADPDDHVQRTFGLWLLHLFELQRLCSYMLVVLVQSCRFHDLISSSLGMPYRVASSPRQKRAFPSMLTRTVRANRRCCTTASRGTALPSGSTTSGASAEESIPSSLRRSRYFSNSADGGTSSSLMPAKSAGEWASASRRTL